MVRVSGDVLSFNAAPSQGIADDFQHHTTCKKVISVIASAGLLTSNTLNIWLATTASIVALAAMDVRPSYSAECVTGVATTFTNVVDDITKQSADAVTGIAEAKAQFVNGVTTANAVTEQGALTTEKAAGLNSLTTVATTQANAVTAVGTLSTDNAKGLTADSFGTASAITDTAINTSPVVTGFAPTTIDAVTNVGFNATNVLKTATLNTATTTVVTSVTQTPFTTTNAVSATGSTNVNVVSGTAVSSVIAAAPFSWTAQGANTVGGIDRDANGPLSSTTSGTSNTVTATSITGATATTITILTGTSVGAVYNGGGTVSSNNTNTVLTNGTTVGTTDVTINSVDNTQNTTKKAISALNETYGSAYIPTTSAALANVITASNPSETEFLTDVSLSDATIAPFITSAALSPKTTDFLTSAIQAEASKALFVNGTTSENALTSVTPTSALFLKDISFTKTPVVATVAPSFSGASSVGNSLGCGPGAQAAVGGTALGPQAVAGTNAVAIGLGAQATGTGSVAVGEGSVASATASTAIGNGAEANHDGSTAIGAGAKTTATNQIMLGTANNTYQAPGITSPASKASQSGALQVVTSDAQGHLATDGGAIFGKLDALQNNVSAINKHLKETDAGVAMALAMSGGFLPDGKQFAISANYGFFNGENAVATNMFFRVSPNIIASGGLGVGVSDDSGNNVGGRFGVQLSF